LGKVADLVETGSPLQIGLRGTYRGVSFELTGRAQLGHQAGGVWDEWYAAFEDGRWGWLAEAQGRFYLTFQQDLPDQALVPPFEALELGQPVAALSGSVPLMVAETGVARALGAKGEIPYRLVPGEEYYYADLSGPGGAFGTLDYSETPPLVFIGREVSLADLEFGVAFGEPEREVRRVEALHLSCPRCGGALDLRAPDKTERVTCPNCGSLLDVSEGKLEFLKALEPPKVAPAIPLGTVGEIGGGRFTVIGFMKRSVEFEGVRYYWDEYLLYDPQVGFRWLVSSDDHWNFVIPVQPGEVFEHARNVHYGGRRFKRYQDAVGRVENVLGEFYWKVTVGEQVQMADFIAPPLMLSKEVSLSDQLPVEEPEAEPERVRGKKSKRKRQKRPIVTGEVNWSLGTYLERRQVERTFGVTGLPASSKVAPNQPFLHKKVYGYWLLLMVVMLLFGLGIIATGSRRQVFESSYNLQPLKGADASEVIFTDRPFDLRARQNIKITAKSNVENTWLFVEGDLINEATGLVQAFSMPVEYFHGVEGGESWSEGSRESDIHLSALPEGPYTLRLDVSWERWQQPAYLAIRIEQDVPRVLHLILGLSALSVIPLLVGFYHYRFEVRRWADSDYSPYASSDD
jgi:hypothetical protein